MFKHIIVIILLFSTVLNEKFDWLQQLANNIQNEAQLVNEIIILQTGTNSRNEKWKVEDILFGVLIKFPRRIINFEAESPKDQISKLSPILGDPKAALFVLLHYQTGDENFSQLSESMNFLNNISDARSRPKLLIVSFEIGNAVKYGKLLHRMWSLDFLDVTVTSILKVKKFYTNDYQLSAVYHYNPHTNKTTKTRQLRLKLFPDKTLNLQQYPINVLVQNYPPEIFLTKIETEELSGIGWSKMRTLSNAMNFKLIISYKNRSSFLDCDNKHNSTGYYLDLIQRKVEFHSLEFQKFGSCDEVFYEWAAGIIETNIALVVPVLATEHYVFNDKWAICRWLLMTSFPYIIWLCLQLSRTHSKNLQLMYLIQITLGSTVPRVPQKIKDRIIFALLIISCTLSSSMIYTALTDVGLIKKRTYFLETINDVLSSNVSTVVLENNVKLLENVSNESRLLMKKAIRVNDNPINVINQVLTLKNMTFITFSAYAKFLLQEKRDRCNMPIAKILDNDYIAPTISGTVMAARSPYVNRVNVLLQRLIQSGITENWKKTYEKEIPKHAAVLDFSCFNRSIEVVETFWKTFILVGILYSLSIFTFFGEMFVLYRWKYIAGKFKVAKHLQKR